jgi:hypothetical protein
LFFSFGLLSVFLVDSATAEKIDFELTGVKDYYQDLHIPGQPIKKTIQKIPISLGVKYLERVSCRYWWFVGSYINLL